MDSVVQSFPRSRTTFLPALKTAVAAMALTCSAQALAQNASAAPRLPDLASYNCAALENTASTRHIGQVVKGRYYEWHEIYVLANGQQRLGCISLLRPSPQQLSSDEAKTFLTNAFAVGAPAVTATEPNSTQSVAPDTEPANVKPEPLKRPGKAPASDSGAEKKSSITDLPPIPASKNFNDPALSSPSIAPSIAPSKERSSAIAPEYAYESPQTVGEDDRVQITATQTFPWNTLAYLSVTYPNGDSFRCSATLVSPYVVLTAGHCIHNRDRGGYVSSARVYPGQSQNGNGSPIRPFGMKEDVEALQTTAQWTQISGEDTYAIDLYRHDLAAIQFRTSFTHTGTFMPVLYGNIQSPVTEAGYPAAVKGANTMGLFVDEGSETNQSINSLRQVHVREFRVDATGGNSGGPLFYTDPVTIQRYVVGLLSYGEDIDDQGGGPWYDSWNQSLVSGWVSWTPGTATAGSVNGLRVASVFSSSLSNVISFLRFYNAGTTGGTVEVTLADYATGNALATWTSPNIAAKQTRQYALSEIEANASAAFTKPSLYSVSVRPTFTGAFQNTLWNTASASLSNSSTCGTAWTDQKTLINVYSSRLSPYTSVVVIHNTGTSSITPTLGIYNAGTGQRITGYTTNNIPANSQIMMEIGTLEQAAGINPTGNVFQYNIIAETNFTGYMQQLLNNQPPKMIVDMTAACAMTP